MSAPLLFLDVTVRHGVPGDAVLLRAAAASDGAVASRGEVDKRRRYPSVGVPFRCVPLAVETYGRMGAAALKHLRWLAKGFASGVGGEWSAASHNWWPQCAAVPTGRTLESRGHHGQ